MMDPVRKTNGPPTCSAVLPERPGRPGRPGRAAASASSAPCFAIRQIDTIVERSTPHLSAASRWVACWVKTCTNTSYFSEGASRLRDLEPGFGWDTLNLLNG